MINDTINIIQNHRTYRCFKSGVSLPRDHLQAIIDCARQAPSWMDGQHYSIINVSSPELRAQIAALQTANPQIATCSTYLVFMADLYRAKLCSRACNGSFSAAGEPDSLITAVTDAALAAQNAVVAAESLGYATCYTGSIRSIIAPLIKLLALPPNTFPVFGLCIGVADTATEPPKPRLPEKAVYAENQYPSEQTLEESLKAYEQTIAELGEAREKFPYRQKISYYYNSIHMPENTTLLKQQGWLTDNGGNG